MKKKTVRRIGDVTLAEALLIIEADPTLTPKKRAELRANVARLTRVALAVGPKLLKKWRDEDEAKEKSGHAHRDHRGDKR